jgi:PAS domain-containing protein
MLGQRAANACLIALLVLVSGAAVFDSLVHRGSTTLTPWLLGGMASCSVLALLSAYRAAQMRARALEANTSGLQRLAEKLEDSLATLSAVNARLHQSETRYKGLVDAQGDAILRRDHDSRLRYGNDSFFRLFGLDPQQAIGAPFAPEVHPDSRMPELVHLDKPTGMARARAMIRKSVRFTAGAGLPGRIFRYAMTPVD